jgi:hypothetical protein
VEPESAVVDEGRLVGAWQEFVVHAKWYGKVNPWLGVNVSGTGLVRCTPAMSVSSMAPESYDQTVYITTFGILEGT